MSKLIPGPTQVENHEDDVLDGVWVPTGAQDGGRSAVQGRILQSEERGELRRILVNTIRGADEIIMISSFLFADLEVESALLEVAKKRGVRVYMLVATEARLDKELRSNDTFGWSALEDHKRLLDELAGWVYVRSAEHFHAKFVLVDPRTNPRGILFTANLTEDALTRNHELAVLLRPAEVLAFSALFSWSFWESAQRELLFAKSLPSVQATKRLELPWPAGGVVATAGERKDLRETVISMIRSATRTLVISTFGIDHPEILEALEERVRRGIAVSLLVRHPRPTMLETLSRLSRVGVEVIGVGKWLHAKAILVDSARGLVMTANLQSHGLDEGFEVGVLLDGEDAVSPVRMLDAWRAHAPWRFRGAARLGDLRGPIQVPNGDKYRDLVVEVNERLDDVSVKVDCCTKIAGAACPKPKRLPDGKLYHRIERIWWIEPPSLARGAKPVTRAKPKEGDAPPFPIFEEPSGRQVFVIDTLAELAAAERQMRAFGVNAVVLRS